MALHRNCPQAPFFLLPPRPGNALIPYHVRLTYGAGVCTPKLLMHLLLKPEVRMILFNTEMPEESQSLTRHKQYF